MRILKLHTQNCTQCMDNSARMNPGSSMEESFFRKSHRKRRWEDRFGMNKMGNRPRCGCRDGVENIEGDPFRCRGFGENDSDLLNYIN
jgi:hypothetical protein